MIGYKNKGIYPTIILPLFVFALALLTRQFGSVFISYLEGIVSTKISDQNFLLHFSFLLFLAIITGFFANKFGTKQSLLPATGFLAIWFFLSMVASKFMEVDLLFAPVLLTVSLILLSTHFLKLLTLNSELNDKLNSLSSTGQMLEGKSADLRIESGLKLLETILPISEAIIFRITKNNRLDPVGRSKSTSNTNSSVSRQTSWQENVGLCEEVLKSQQTIVRSDNSDNNKVRIALPLIYEKIVIGVLYVKVEEGFESEDKKLLEAFSWQLARNFLRKELREKTSLKDSYFAFLSTDSAQKRLDIVSLAHSIFKEQSFGAIAGSNLHEAHAIAYLDGTIAYLNQPMQDIAKLSSQEVSKIDLFSLLDKFKTEVFSEPSLAIRKVLQTDESYRNELSFAETGKTFDMQITLVKVPSNEKLLQETSKPQFKPGCFLVTFRDITAVKENEKLRSDTASLMSHELRTPITSINGFSELMVEDENLTEDQREFLTTIVNESKRVSKMLDSYLSVSNLEQADKQEVFKSTLELNSVVREVVEDYKEKAKRKRIRLIEETKSETPLISADKGLIARAISNLIDNAIRYSPERTSVIISTMLEADFLKVVVEDRGYGIHSDEHEKIWQKFYRVARDGQDKEEESTGLGLSLVKEVAEQHGGNVLVESEVGQGSKFSILLPRL